MNLTSIVLITVFFGLVIFDVLLYALNMATISQVVTEVSFYTPFLPLLFGILLGHWLWPQTKE